MTFNLDGKTYCLISVDGMVEFILKTPDGTAIKHSMSEDIALKMIGINAALSDECEDYNICSDQQLNKFFFPAVEVVEVMTKKEKKKKTPAENDEA